ncbi:hypothetical protein ACWD6R_06600 [Streptomyces sp. NPDC005151]
MSRAIALRAVRGERARVPAQCAALLLDEPTAALDLRTETEPGHLTFA